MISVKERWTLRVSASSSGERLDHVGQRLDPRHQIGLLGDEVAEPHALRPLDEDADRAVRDLEHPGDDPGDPHVVELVGAGLVELGVTGGDQDQHPLAESTSLTSLIERCWPTASGISVSGIGDHVLERQHRQRRRDGWPWRSGIASSTSGVSTTSIVGPPSPAGPGHRLYSSVSIGTRRLARPAERSGSSTRRMPSS